MNGIAKAIDDIIATVAPQTALKRDRKSVV